MKRKTGRPVAYPGQHNGVLIFPIALMLDCLLLLLLLLLLAGRGSPTLHPNKGSKTSGVVNLT